MPEISDHAVSCPPALASVEQKRVETVVAHRSTLIKTRRNRAVTKAGIPSPDALRQMMDYDPATGELTWKPRDAAMFTAGSAGQRVARTPEHKCANWNARLAGKPALNASTTGGYRFGTINKRVLKAHRVAWAMFHGEWPKGDIDHINGDASDNRIANLRDVPHDVNMRNMKRRSDNTSGHSGISWYAQTGRWHARVGSTRTHVGFFKTIKEAVVARDKAREGLGYTDRGEDA